MQSRLPHNYGKNGYKNIFGKRFYVKKSDRFIPLFIMLGLVCGTAALPKAFQLVSPQIVFAPIVAASEGVTQVNALETAVAGQALTADTPSILIKPTYKTGKVTAYSCGGLKNEAEIDMNCPSIRRHPNGKTSSGTTPRAYITVACDREYMGQKFILDGIGEVTCEDTGGAIKGEGRFDLYLPTIKEARQWGVQELMYRSK